MSQSVLERHVDARVTKEHVEAEGRRCPADPGRREASGVLRKALRGR